MTPVTGLWRHPDFLKLWAGQTISVFGSLITRTALPFAAILVLGATPRQMALLAAADLAPGLLVGLAAGAWVDRVRRRPVLIAADLGRALLLGSIPLAAYLDVLGLGQLYLVALLTGTLTTFFDVAYQSYLPTLVRREDLVEGNSKLSASASVAEVGAFGLGGWLVQWLTAPLAILIDACSFVLSALFVLRIRAPEPPPAPPEERPGLRREVAEGVREVWGNPVLRALAGCHLTVDFSFRVFGTVFLLYATRELGFQPGVLGTIFAVGGVTSLLGALIAGRVGSRLGAARTMALGLLLTGLGMLCVPLAHRGAALVAAGLLVANQLLTDPGYTLFEIHAMSLRQAVTPDELRGRVNANIRFLGIAAMLLGAWAGGLLGETLGLRPTLVVGACGTFVAAIWLKGRRSEGSCHADRHS